MHVSAATFESGPAAAGSLMAAFPLFGSTVATSTAAATSPDWPTSLGGTTVTVRDAAGVEHAARLSYASPAQVNYQVPENSAAGNATVTIQVGGESSSANIYITASYPHLFTANATGLAAAQIVRVRGGVQTVEDVAQVDTSGNVVAKPIDLGPATDRLVLVLYGTGIRSALFVLYQIGGNGTLADGTNPVAYAGDQATYPGLDQVNIELFRPVLSAGQVTVNVFADGKRANPVTLTFR